MSRADCVFDGNSWHDPIASRSPGQVSNEPLTRKPPINKARDNDPDLNMPALDSEAMADRLDKDGKKQGYVPRLARRNAGKIVDTGDGLAPLGFLHDDPDGFIGAIADPIPVQIERHRLFRPFT